MIWLNCNVVQVIRHDGRRFELFPYLLCTVKILKFGTPQTIAILVLTIEKFDVTLH